MKPTKRRNTKVADWRFLVVVIAVMVALPGGIFYFAVRMAPPPTQQTQDNDSSPPFFSSAAAAQPLPNTDEPSSFSNQYVAAAYGAAKQIPGVLAQQPCYCYCKRRGHRSLLDCFATKHAADCDICVREAMFAVQEHKRGKSAEQIRAEIVDGAWKAIQVSN